MTKPAKISNSYMEFCLHVDGGENIYLRVPTVWDDVEKKWRGFVKTPKLQKLIHGSGKDSFELQNSFNREFSQVLNGNDEFAGDAFSMFHPLSYWDEMNDTN